MRATHRYPVEPHGRHAASSPRPRRQVRRLARHSAGREDQPARDARSQLGLTFLLAIATPRAAWECPGCHKVYLQPRPDHDCPADRPPDDLADLFTRTRIVHPALVQYEREQERVRRDAEYREFRQELAADLGPLLRRALEIRPEAAHREEVPRAR